MVEARFKNLLLAIGYTKPLSTQSPPSFIIKKAEEKDARAIKVG